MAKQPAAGQVKTRLARDIGVAAAVRYARHAIAITAARVASPRRWETIIAVSPARAVTYAWPCALKIVPQTRGNLGARMQHIIDTAPAGPVVIIGTDIPRIHMRHIADAFRLLGRHDAVFGPASDGGYWLVGMRRRPRVLRAFANVRWSTAHALADTLDNLQGRSVGYVATLSDVDTAQDLRAHRGEVGKRILAEGCK